MRQIERSGRLLGFSLIALSFAATAARAESGAEATQRARRLAAKRYIGMTVPLPDSAFAGGLRVCSRETPSGIVGYWKVAPKMVDAIDGELRAHVRKSGIDKGLPFSFSLYVRQYAGFVRDGKRFVYMNALLLEKNSPMVEQAKKALPSSCAGISGSWSIQYDTSTKKFQDFTRS
jgi:hypothetical protein